VTNEDSSNDSKCKNNYFLFKKKSLLLFLFILAIPSFSKQNCFEIGDRRTFSCRINSRKKRSNRPIATNSTGKYRFFSTTIHIFFFYLIDNYSTIDFVGYIKQYSLINDDQNEGEIRIERRRSSINTLTPSDVLNAIGTNPTSCLLTMGNLSKLIEKSDQTHENLNTIDRMFLCKLNPDGQFTYFDHM
jgi:hypothetical protein